MTNINTNGDGTIAITEALKRLAEQNITPARQSFYAAVKCGKIREVIDKENNPDSRRLVSWDSVLEYISAGGFKPRRRKKHPQPQSHQNQPQHHAMASHPAAAVGPGLPADCQKETSSENRFSQPNLPADPNPLITGTSDNVTHSSLKKDRPPRKKSPRKPRVTDGIRSKKVKAIVDPKNRKPVPLRLLKNPLRRLSFEETKHMRDWLDNRLLTILRPMPVVEQSGGAEIANSTQTETNPIPETQ